MKQLNLKNINSRTPYYVHEREDKQHEFYFWMIGKCFAIGSLSFGSIITKTRTTIV